MIQENTIYTAHPVQHPGIISRKSHCIHGFISSRTIWENKSLQGKYKVFSYSSPSISVNTILSKNI